MEPDIRAALALEPDPDVREAMLHLRAALLSHDWDIERRHRIALMDIEDKIRSRARDSGALSVVEK